MEKILLLYFHIPFCDSKCHYCAFTSYSNQKDLKAIYMNCALKQLKHDLQIYKIQKNSIKSVFIGGGTPSSVDANLYHVFFQTIFPYLINNPEITSEANPNFSNLTWLKTMFEFGVNRISFGIQSFYEEKLKLLGRSHNKEIAIKSVEQASKIGFEHISIDLMYSTILDTKKRLKNEVDLALKLPINHISAYSLTLEENTKLFKKPKTQKDLVENSRFIQNYINKFLPQYEISSFGKYKCKHNLGYWNHENYLGIGCSAVGFVNNTRYYPNNKLENYIKNPLEKIEENLSNEDFFNEKIFLGLRSSVGIDIKIFDKPYLEKIAILEKEKLIRIKNEKIFSNDFLLADELALFIMNN